MKKEIYGALLAAASLSSSGIVFDNVRYVAKNGKLYIPSSSKLSKFGIPCLDESLYKWEAQLGIAKAYMLGVCEMVINRTGKQGMVRFTLKDGHAYKGDMKALEAGIKTVEKYQDGVKGFSGTALDRLITQSAYDDIDFENIGARDTEVIAE